MTVRLAVFASGGGSNLQALLDRFNHIKESSLRVVLVLSDRADAGALTRAREAGVDATLVKHKDRPSDLVTREMLALLESASVDLIALAGYLRLVPSAIVRKYRNRIVNIHPALLPAFGGQGMFGENVHRAVLGSGCSVTGPTVHFVDEQYDEGRIIAQWPVPVMTDDTPATLAARVLHVEHMLYPAALELVARSFANEAGEPICARLNTTAFTTLQQQAPDEAQLRRALGLD